jgi:hypothetical protein
MTKGKKYRTKFASLVGFCNNNNFEIIGLYGFECPGFCGRRSQGQEGFRYPYAYTGLCLNLKDL